MDKSRNKSNITLKELEFGIFLIIVSNLVILIMFFLNILDFKETIIAYWVETLIIVFINILKIFIAKKFINRKESIKKPPIIFTLVLLSKFIIIPIFSIIYGILLFGLAVYIDESFKAFSSISLTDIIGNVLNRSCEFRMSGVYLELYIGIFLLFISHLFVFFKKFLIGDEKNKVTIIELCYEPFIKIIIIFFSIILSLWYLEKGYHKFFLIVFINAKVYFEIIYYLKHLSKEKENYLSTKN